MKALRVVGIALGTLCLLGLGFAAYVWYRLKHIPDTGDLGARVDDACRDAVRSAGIPVLMVAVEKDGRQYVQAYGMRGDAPSLDAVFEIGSITKVFTALAAQTMVADGIWRWEDHVHGLLPEGRRPATDDGTNLLHLATHRSGLPRLAPSFLQGDIDACDPYRMLTPDSVLAQYARQEGKTMPGSRAEYSNWGMGLLGHLMELRTGRPYEELVRERVLAPLGMSNTFIRPSPEQAGAMVTGHDAGGTATCPWEFGALQGAGAFRSTITDMARFLQAAVDQRALPGIAWEEAFRERASDGGMGIGLGWHIDTTTGRLFGLPRIIWHNGGTGGFSSYIGLSPERRIGVAVLANRGQVNDAVDKLGFDLLLRARYVSFAPRQ